MIITAWIFSRWMALIYLAAFWSLGTQILGLVGHNGILPAVDYLHYIKEQDPLYYFWQAPTLCWLNTSDGFLLFLCWGGAALSLLLLAGVWPALTAFLLWLFYLSVTIAGQDFLGFQWDNLLLEAGFLLIFLFPQPFSLHLRPSVRPSRVFVWLLRFLLFKLMLESGLVKLLSGDTNWSHLRALTFHYWTQPLPNMFSWYAAQLPLWFQKFSCLILFLIELFFPFLIFAGRWGRLAAFFGIAGLQVLILLTGNYCFFNFLAIGLCITLLEDEHFKNLSFLKHICHSRESGNPIVEGGLAYKIISGIFAGLIALISCVLLGAFANIPVSKPLDNLIMWQSPLRSVNNYGLFAVMTTQRDEIILEGSNDGTTWLPYEFRYKPGDVKQAPKWAAPHQPRLDWQMWFASLGSWKDNQWVIALMYRLLQGSPDVLNLLGKNPFPDHPPKYVQAVFWGYHFTDFKERAATGAWWRRDIKGLYCPTVSLRQ